MSGTVTIRTGACDDWFVWEDTPISATSEISRTLKTTNSISISRIYFLVERSYTVLTEYTDGTIEYDEREPPYLTFSINGRYYTTSGKDDTTYWIDFPTPILFDEDNPLMVELRTINHSYEEESTADNIVLIKHIVNIKPYLTKEPWHGYYFDNLASGFFAVKIEGECSHNWSISGANDGYPRIGYYMGGFYENENLPREKIYKLDAGVNDGYPYIFKAQSGWVFAYPYRKNTAWLNAMPYVKVGGAWKAVNAMVYDARSALYQRPMISGAWRITQGINSSYPYVVYDEIPFYEEEIDSGNTV